MAGGRSILYSVNDSSFIYYVGEIDLLSELGMWMEVLKEFLYSMVIDDEVLPTDYNILNEEKNPRPKNN